MTLFINWAVKPFSMALLGWLFIGWLLRPYLPAEQITSYIAGLLISVGLYIVAPAILAQIIRQLTITIGKIAESVLIDQDIPMAVYAVLMFLVSFWMGRWLPWQAQEPIGSDALARLAASNLGPAIV